MKDHNTGVYDMGNPYVLLHRPTEHMNGKTIPEASLTGPSVRSIPQFPSALKKQTAVNSAIVNILFISVLTNVIYYRVVLFLLFTAHCSLFIVYSPLNDSTLFSLVIVPLLLKSENMRNIPDYSQFFLIHIKNYKYQ